MKVDRKWLWLGGGALAAGAGALALGVPLGTLLVVGALLACPAVMCAGMMRGGRQGEGGMACHPGSQEAGRKEAGPVAASTNPSRTEDLARSN